MGKHTLNEQITHRFAGLMRIGESRHAAKIACGANHDFHKTVDGVYSIQSRHTYEAACNRFADWCRENEGVGKRAALDSLRPYATDYLAARDADARISADTVRTERAALGKMFGEQIPYTIENETDITRSRESVANDRHFSEERNADLVAVCRATGGRRDDIARLTPSNFHEDGGGRLFVRFEDSKGGRPRESYVLDEYRETVERVRDAAYERGGDDERLFDHVHSAADVHSYRREYAQAIYEAAQADSGLRKAVIDQNNAIKTIKHSTPDSGDYRRRDGSGNVYDRAALQTGTLCMGHSRYDVFIDHYLT